MHNNSLRAVSSVLSAALLLGLAACGGGNPGGTDGGQSSGTNKGTDESGFKFTSYPMDAEDVHVTWYVNHGPVLNTAYGSWEESPFHSGLNEMTGVDIEWKFPTAGADTNQDFNLMIASETLPDIMYGPVVKSAERYIDEGVVRDLSDVIEEHAPAYYEWISAKEVREKAMKTDSGQYIGFGFFREDGGWNDTYLGPVIRQDWLTEQNLELPKTISEFENVLKVFKEEYGAVFSFTWPNRFNNIGLAGAFGAHGGTVFQTYVDGDKKIQLAQTQPEWRDYMAKLSEWYAAGLVDQDIFTLDDTSTQTKALNEVMGVSFTSMGQLSNWVKDAEAAANGAEWVGLQYPTDDSGKLSSVFGGYGIDPNNVAFVTGDADEEKLPVIMRLLDYAYTEEGLLYWNYGKEGVSWEYNDEGEVEYLPLVLDDKDGLNNAISKYGGSTWSGPNIQATRMLHLKNTEVSIEANNIWFYENEEQTYADKLPPGISYTVDEAKEIADLETPISTYISESAAAFMTGEKSIDEFDAFVSDIEDMNVARLLEIYQAAYDRFQSR